jgi:copper chaperone
MKTIVFKIDGMNCDGCADTIQGLIEKEPGVRMASVSFADRQARVLFDPQAVQEERLVDVIQGQRFRVVSRQPTDGSSRWLRPNSNAG